MPRRPRGCGADGDVADAAPTATPARANTTRTQPTVTWRNRILGAPLVACERTSTERGLAESTMDLEQFCSASRIVVVAGKGGVGKTTVTAALATAAARAGASVLIVEVEGKSGLAATLGCPPLTYEEQPVRERLRARTLTPDEALREYLEDRGPRRRRHRGTGHEGHLGAREGQGARTSPRRGSHPHRRSRRGARHQLPPLAPGPARRGPGGAGPGPS